MYRMECRNEIRSHMKAIDVFKSRQESLNNHNSQRYDDSHDIAIDNVENAVLDIGSSMVRRASKRAAVRASRRTSTISTATDSRSGDRDVYQEDGRRFSPPSVNSTRQLTTYRPPLHESSSVSHRLMTDHPIAMHPRDVPRHENSPLTPKSSFSSLESYSVQSLDHPQSDGAENLDEGDYIGVQASDSFLHFDPDLNYQVASGYINSNVKPTNASLNSEFPQNVISELHAVELGLEIEYHDQDGENRMDTDAGAKDIEMTIDFGNGEVQPVIGSTTFLWKNSVQLSHLRPLRVTCLVSKSMPFQIPLVFGQLYINRQTHYWRI